jgi:replicative superfamily II helicase
VNEAVEAALRDLLHGPAIDQAMADAQSAWIRLQFGLSSRWSLPEDVVAIGHQVALLSTDVPPSLDEIPADLRIRLESLAASVDIAARLTEDRQREFAKLAASLYLTSQQPTRALRAALRLRSLGGIEATTIRVHRILETAYRMNGARAVQSVTDAVSKESFDETGHPFVDALAASAWDPGTFRILREAETALRYREQHDLRRVVGTSVPSVFLDRSYDGPAWSRRQELLPSQVSVVRAGLLEDRRAFVSTPTGTGKTFLAELKIAHELNTNPQGLIVYVAPLNALARQVHRDFQRRLSSIAEVTLWTGAYEIDESVADLGNVLVTTPEKLDSILRLDLAEDARSQDLLERVSLVIADEAHQVSDGSRGILYEFLLLRVKRRLAELGIVALSAVQSDPAPFARFLRMRDVEAGVHRVEWSATTVWDLLWTKGGELLARVGLDEPPKVTRPKQAKAAAALAAATLVESLESVLIVEARRDWAESLAAELFGEYREYLDQRLLKNSRAESDMAELEALAEEIQDRLYPNHPLAQYVRSGLAVHHAGLPPAIRRRIEELARRELLHTLVATTTLAEGVDLPFRAVILCRLALPFGLPFRSARIHNIRGRAARPGFASDGIFLILQPENVDTAAYQYFLDHYWEETVKSVESPSALVDLFSTEPMREAPALRSLESQLLAFYSENEVELANAGSVATETLFAEAFGQTSTEVSRLAAGVQRTTERMLEAPALLKVASPISPTSFGRAAILGGLSASSALLVRDAMLANLPEMAVILEQGGPAELAIRLAWLPWEAVETTDEYRDTVSRRRTFQRSVDLLPELLDKRLESAYQIARLLLSRRLLPEIAENEPKAIRGRASDDRLARLVEWGGRAASVLPWTLTGVLRIADSLVAESAEIGNITAGIAPFVQYISAWVPAEGGAELVRRGVLDRDAALRLLAASGLWTASSAELAAWAQDHEDEATALVGIREYRSLLRNAPDDIDPEGEDIR